MEEGRRISAHQTEFVYWDSKSGVQGAQDAAGAARVQRYVLCLAVVPLSPCAISVFYVTSILTAPYEEVQGDSLCARYGPKMKSQIWLCVCAR